MSRHLNRLLVPFVCLLAFIAEAPIGSAQLNQNCTVSILNRSTQVGADGTWVINNVPANFGLIRARATCVQNGMTEFGQSGLFQINANQITGFNANIVLGNTTPIPTSITITAPTTTLTSAGATAQLTVTAAYAGSPSQDITASSTGTQYNISNPAIATITANGLVTAVATGTVAVQAVNEGAQGLTTIQVTLSGIDSDGDGIPDDAEIRLGLNPHDPTDALLDPDHDGLTNLQEYMLGTDIHNPDTDGDGLTDGQEVLIYHTNPLLFSTDGSGIPDGIEVQTGTLGGSLSSKIAASLMSLSVTPAKTVLAVNTIQGQASQQLKVLGLLIDGKTTIDLTSTDLGTTYSSSDLTICNFGAPDGNVFAGNSGTCTITIQNGTFTATAQLIVTGFTPVPLSQVSIPGYANMVAINGNYAYIAAGSAGLQVVDVSNKSQPVVVAALATPGNADDIYLVGNLAYISDDSAGLVIIDVTKPLAPALAGAFPTPGVAWHTAVANGLAYIADGSAGVQVVDVQNSAAPFLLGSISLPGTTEGLDVDITRNLVVAVGTNGLYTINVANPRAPAMLGSLNYGGIPQNVVLHGNFAYIADSSASLTSVNVTNPSTPVFGASGDPNLAGELYNITIQGTFALGGAINFINTGVTITDISSPPALNPRGILYFMSGTPQGFRQFDKATGIAADGTYVYLTTDQTNGTAQRPRNGTTADTRLNIGQYATISDPFGIPPTVSISAPANGAQVVAGSMLTVMVQASDDVAVAVVNILVNGQQVFSATSSPYQYMYQVPLNATTLTIGAQAVDYGFNVGTAQSVTVSVIPDPGTTVTGKVIDNNGNPVAGAAVTFGSLSTTSASDGTFTLKGVPTVQGTITVLATALIGGKMLRGSSAPTAPVPAGTTNVGNIRLSGGAVGLITCDTTSSTVISALTATNLINTTDLTYINACSTAPTLASLANYSAVLVWSNSPFGDPVGLGNVLADFVDQGGGVVLATYSFSQTWMIGGRITTAGYSPFAVSASTLTPSGVLNLSNSNTASPIMQGVTATSYFVNSNYTNPALTTGSSLIAVDTSGNNVVAVNATNRVVGISIYPGYGDMGLLFANAIGFVE